ncbi:MFS transporter [Mycoplasma bradburyae]|uniref:MFS transporter n=1 Tax=Mycoplasma bradburyae TaxID=2963128 RepID=A0AAW6HNT5_9MOLU|nr:MFS transporter [Mycoplasma bradburyae]MDC4163023.1 MFS transporter [Mycoplasma bradburyae]MDC4181634.1 MFS transporter [Mycoplasma bradburyae]MDC4182361.1 MFS transporter [Mycoplasma bradburyae]MDC4183087.1 MFS transporter [Mycoplasma bradburyae]MDC4183805.1 MFS transporter [Mycoplasma bradburyae]
MNNQLDWLLTTIINQASIMVSDKYKTSLIINLSLFLICLIVSAIFFWKIKFENKGYKKLFIFYTIFWIPIFLVRSYRGSLHNDLMLDRGLLYLPLSLYGFVGIFTRPLFDYLGIKFKSRKKVIFTALLLQLVTFIPIIIKPSFATNLIQVIGVGIGASCIGSFSLWFNEQHAKEKPFLAISILSIPPLLADFIASPIQSLIRTLAITQNKTADVEITKYLWLIGLIAIIINLVFWWFLRENPQFVGLKKDDPKNIIDKSFNKIYSFVVAIIFAAIVIFTKFAISDGIAQITLQQLVGNSNSAPYEGYLSNIFSGAQLLGGVLMGVIGVKYFDKWLVAMFGSLFFILYNVGLILLINTDALETTNKGYVYLAIQSISGFGYGILYNLLIAHALSYGFKTNKITPLGINQTTNSIAITFANFFTSFIKDKISINFIKANTAISYILIGIILVGLTLYFFSSWIENGKKIKPIFTKKPFKYYI